MDRSQVRQFGISRSIYNSKLMGLNSTLHVSPRSSIQRDFNSRKSRITNIPDTKHINLSTKLDMVVVFQTIQIQRLNEQIDTLRARVRQYQRQLFNYDHYEIQIKELTEKCFNIQSQKNSYRQELFENKQASQLIFNQLEEIKKKYMTVDFTTNQKYKLEKKRNEELMMEVEKWKSRYHALDQSKSKQFQTIKKITEQQSKSSLSRQTKDLLDRFQSQKHDMEQLIRTLKQTNVEKQTQLKKIKFELQNKDKSLEEMEKQVDQYEEKVALLSQENYRLLELSKIKQQQINKLKEKVKQGEESSIIIGQEILTKTEENRRVSSKLQKIQQSLSQKDQQLNRLQKLSLSDKQRLSQLDRIVFLLKQRQNQLEGKNNKAIERKDKKILLLQEELKEMKQTQRSTWMQISSLKKQNQVSLEIISQLLQRVEKMTILQQSVKKKTQQSFQQIEKYKIGLQKEVSQKIGHFIDHLNKLVIQLNQNQEYINSLQQTNRKSHQKIVEQQAQKAKFLDKISELKAVEESYRAVTRQNEKLKYQIQKLVNERDELIQEIQSRQTQIMSQTQIQLKTMEQNYQNNIIKDLKQQLTNKEIQYNQLKQNASQLENNLKQFQTKTKFIQQESHRIISNVNIEWENKFRTLAQDLDEKSQIIMRQKAENQNLTQALDFLVNFYRLNVQNQIQAIMSRVQPMQLMMRNLKSFLFQKLIRQHQRLMQKLKSTQQKVHQLVQFNFILMQKNQYLFQHLMQCKQFRFESLNQYQQKTNNFYQKTSQNFNYPNSTAIGMKINETIKNNFNNQLSTSIPLEFLIKHVIVCAELQSLRHRIGDKNAKVQNIRKSLKVSNVSSNKSFVAIVNGAVKSQHNNENQNHDQDLMLHSGLTEKTIINKLNNPFMHSVVRTINNQHSIIHQSRLVELTERTSRIHPESSIRRVTSEQRFGVKSPDNTSIKDDSQSSRNNGIYTKRVSGLGRNGFKSIGIKKSIIYN